MMVHVTTAMFAGHPFERALELASGGVGERYGQASMKHVQLCPQSHGILDVDLAERLKARYPATRFRPHANVRISHEFHKYDASTPWDISRSYFEQLAAVNRALGGEPYSLHAGRRGTADLGRMADNVRRIQDVMGVPVAVEGLYPNEKNEWLLSTWSEYSWALESGLNLAIDLSHLNIVAERSGERHDDLVRELVASPQTFELHVSTNRGSRDEHLPVDGSEWWWELLYDANPKAVAFSEGMVNPLRRGAAAY